MLGPPSTLAGQKRGGYLLVTTAVVLTIVFTVFAVADGAPWTRLLAVYLVTGVLAAAGLRQVVAARRGRFQFDEAVFSSTTDGGKRRTVRATMPSGSSFSRSEQIRRSGSPTVTRPISTS